MVLTAWERNPAVPLSGDWRFRTDPDDHGEEAEWHDPDVAWNGQCVSVPHAWQEHDGLREYTGAAWYRRTFEFSGVAGDERALLSFGAVDHTATVWVNGERIGENEGGYLPFTVDATDAIEAGTNTVALRVHDPEDLSEIPHGKQGAPWYTRVSGPWQRVDLLTVPATHIRNVRATPDLDDDTATIEIFATGGDEVSVTVSREGRVAAEATAVVSDGDAMATVSLVDPDYWTTDHPALYDIEVSLRTDEEVVDTYEDYFGMRSVAVEDGDLVLNGDPLALRGALDQAFYPDTYYRPSDLDTFEREIQAAKECGFNLLRKHIKPAHPAFIEAADRLGILVWEEPANPKRYTEISKRRLREQLHGMIERDYNSPSVIAWSIYNEEWGIGSGDNEMSLWDDVTKQDALETLYQETTAWDETRLVCDNSGWAHVATDLNDYHEYFVVPDRRRAWRDRLDAIAADPAGNYGDARTDPAQTPLVLSEFGTWGLPTLSRYLDRDDEPHWFSHDFLDGLKRPSGVKERFERSNASSVFDSLDGLAAAWQRREFQSIAPIIADVRERPEIDGYVLTELTDVEWEFNGVLDYHREPKESDEVLRRANAPRTLFLDPDSHVARSGEAVTADLIFVNDTNESFETTVSWTCFDATGEIAVAVDSHDARRYEGAISVPAPSVDKLASTEITASTTAPDVTVCRRVYVGPREPPVPDTTVYVDDDSLRDTLADSGYETVSDSSDADVSVVTDSESAAGTTLVVPDMSGHLADTDRFAYAHLSTDESWNLCSSLVYQDLLSAVDPIPGWAFEDIYPYGYVTDAGENDVVSIGYLEGWLENAGAVAMIRGTDDRTGICTLRVTDSYGDHPVATAVVDRLLADLAPPTS